MVEIFIIKTHLHAQFHIKVDPLKFLYFEHGLTYCKPMSIPIDASIKLHASKGFPIFLFKVYCSHFLPNQYYN